jgi:hypothetical protein
MAATAKSIQNEMDLIENPPAPGYRAWDPHPVLDGWDAHQGFRLVERHVIPA